MKNWLRIISTIFAIGLIIFIWHKPKTTITCTDEDGNTVIINSDSLDKAHEESYKNYGK